MEEIAREPRVVRGRIELWVPHNAGEIAFAYPMVGPGTYKDVGSKILKAKQKLPTGDSAASLIHAAYCFQAKEEPEFRKVRGTLRNKWLWIFNRLVWTNRGVYVLQDTEAIGRSEPLTIAELEKRLKGGKDLPCGVRFSPDEMLRFAPKESYVLGERTSEQLATDGLMIATYDIKGAKKCAEASRIKKYNPKTYGVDVLDEGIVKQRVSAVYESATRLHFDGSGWGGGGDRLRVLGGWLGYGSGFAFGVLDKSASQKISGDSKN